MNIPLPRGSALVEVAAGAWLKPRMVTGITIATVPPSQVGERVNASFDHVVTVQCAGNIHSWTFKTAPEASRFARMIAQTCNTEMGITPLSSYDSIRETERAL